MVVDKILNYQYGNDPASRATAARIANTCKADLVYYAVLKAAYRQFGTPGAGRNIMNIHADVLGIARDQMAMRASDQGLLQYASDGMVQRFLTDGRTESEQLTDFARKSFQNSEGIRAMVSSHISNMDAYKGREMDDDERNQAIDRIMREAMEPDSDFMADIRHAVGQMTEGTMGTGGEDTYAMQRFAEGIREEQDPVTKSIGTKYPMEGGGTRPVFKLSPLMPEFRNLRMLQAGGLARGIGLHRNQSSVVSRRLGLDGNPADSSVTNNDIMMYDPEKRLLSKAPDEYSPYGSVSAEYADGFITGVPAFGSEAGSGGAMKPMSFQYMIDMKGDEEHPDRITSRIPRTSYTYQASTVANGINAKYAFRMANILEHYSQQELNEKDYGIIWDIFSSRNPATIFGDPMADSEGVERNADAYFEYIEHVCRETRAHMSSHEFEIHLERHDHFQSRDERGGLVPLLWFTGERTDDYDKARSNPSRYLGVYPYANYVPASMESTPLIGDVAPSTFNSYTVTKGAHRRGGEELNNPETNRYAHPDAIDEKMVADMKSVFDGYIGLASTRDELEITKVRRPVGEDTDVQDLADLVSPDGSVDGTRVADLLADDMDAIKEHQHMLMAQGSQAARMKSVFERFVRKCDIEPTVDLEGDMAKAVASFLEARRSSDRYKGPDSVEDAVALARRLESCARMELQEAYGKDMGSVMVAKHVYGKLLGPLAKKCVDAWYDQDDLLSYAYSITSEDQRGGMPTGTGASDPVLVRNIRGHVSDAIDAFSETGPYSDAIGESMDELFGKRYDDGRVAIRANACRSLSRHYMRDDYNNLLAMLSYSSAAAYEPSVSKPLDGAAASHNAYMVVQRYSPAAYDITNGVLDDADVDQEERDEEAVSASEEKLWFDATFARTEPAEGRFEKTLAWLDSDFSGDYESSQFTRDDVRWDDPEDPLAHALFEATHPLQCAALRDAGRKLAAIEGSGYDPARLAVSDQGVIYYRNANKEVVFKCGPVTDEAAYVRPYIAPADAGDEAAGVAFSMEVPDTDARGRKRRDEKGKVLTTTVRAAVSGMPVPDGNGGYAMEPRMYLYDDGTLRNEVFYGALDSRSVSPEGADENVVLNRFYGISSKIRAYDGYGHDGQAFSERAEMSNYKNSVMENLDRAISVYAVSRNADHTYGGELTQRGKLAMSVFYTNTGANALRKCYQTNTFILEEKPKCIIADSFMSEQVYGGYPGQAYSDEDRAEAEMCADLLSTQADTYHNMVVFPKIELDQNIGLYNQGVNIQQGLANQVRGNLDRKNLRNNDCMSGRAAYAVPNRVYDVALTGSAKNLGARAFLSDAASFDWRTGTLVLDAPGDGDLAGNNTRNAMVSTGVTSFINGGIVMRPSEFPDGQALDRLQLSINAFEKAAHYAKDVRFAMVNFGWNMEDGYVIAKRSARKFGHFDEDRTFHPAELWDKIGDTESGNKGVIAKIVDTDIGAGIADDAAAKREFQSRYFFQFWPQHQFNHGALSDRALADGVSDAVRAYMDADPAMAQYGSLDDYFAQLACDNARTVGTNYGDMQKKMRRIARLEKRASKQEGTENGAKSRTEADRLQEEVAELKNQIFGAMKGSCADIAEHLMKNRTEPFYGSCKLETDLWQFFRDNPDMDMTVTNVCVCTRSNPSLLMHITQNLDEDTAAIESGTLGEDALGRSGCVIRDGNGDPKVLRGAAGTVNVYVDSHTADSKNIDYTTGDASRPGRGLGAQEIYALQAKNAVDGFLPFLMMNDPTRPDAIAKLNRKLMMNGYLISMGTDGGDDPDYRPFKAMVLSDALGDVDLESRPDGSLEMAGVDVEVRKDGTVDATGTDKPMWPYKFVDIDAMAAPVAEAALNTLLEAGSDAAREDALKALGSLDFSKALDPDGHGAKPTEDMLHRMFEASFGRFGGGFMVLPDASYSSSSGGTVSVDGENRTAMPLFLSAREVTNMDSELVATHIDDKLQFRAFKAAMASAVIGRLSGAKLGDVPLFDAGAVYSANKEATSAMTAAYKKVPEQASLSLENMNHWLKKNVYKTVNPHSLTCVWSGSPDVEIDEAGLSFEKAKSLGLLHERKLDEDPDENRKLLDAIPDTYEFMAQRYMPVSDSDLVIVNRSPGQTTGCIRALRLKIIGAKGDGLKIHPALASVFDGDFDGDTVGVANVDDAIAMNWLDPNFAENINAMRHEMSARLSMNGSLLHDAEYTSVTLPDGSERGDVHPLFIAGNADFAWAKKKMMADENGSPACGYDLALQLERATVMANLSDQAKQLKFDKANFNKGLISETAYKRLREARQELIGGLSKYFEDMGPSDGTPKDAELQAEWAESFEKFKNGYNEKKAKPDMVLLESLDRDVCRRVKACYREMTGYLTGPSMAIGGNSHHEMLDTVLRYANDAKKGKLPQLNALLMFAGVHAQCPGEGPRLMVVKAEDGKGFALAYGRTDRDADGNAVFTKICEGRPEQGFDTSIRLDNIRNMSDLKSTPFRSKEVCNLVAQADKSDATGKGGTLAQRLQMELAPAGYGKIGLGVSGPITQKYLDAKQNANDCETNLTIGNSILGPVYHFQKVVQLSEDYIDRQGHHPRQVYKGQFTIGKGDLTLDEGVDQLDRFRQIMGQPPLSRIDRAEIMAGLERFVDASDGKIKDPLKSEQLIENITYTSMYSPAGMYGGVIARMARDGLGLYSGAPYESAAAYCVNKAAQAVAKQKCEQDRKYSPTSIMQKFTEERAKQAAEKPAERSVESIKGDDILDGLLASRQPKQPEATSGQASGKSMSSMDWINRYCAENPMDAGDGSEMESEGESEGFDPTDK